MTDDRARYDHACQLAEQGNRDEAQRQLEELQQTATDPSLKALVANDLGTLAMCGGDRAKAMQLFEAAVALDTECSAAWSNLRFLREEEPTDETSHRGPANHREDDPSLIHRDNPSSPTSSVTSASSVAHSTPDHDTTKIAILSFLFNWPSTGGGIMHTVELAQFLERAGYDVTLLFPRFEPWGIGRMDNCPFPATALPFQEAEWNATGIKDRFRSAVDDVDPDFVIITDCWNFKPHLAEAMRGRRFFLRMQALECLCPLNNLRLLPDEQGGVRQCPNNQLHTPAACAECVTKRGQMSGALHRAERALSGVGTDEYWELLYQSLQEAEAVLTLNPEAAKLFRPYARRVDVVTWGMDPARFPWGVKEKLEDRSLTTAGRPSTDIATILFAGLVHESIKGFHVLHEACALLWQDRQDFQLIVTADPAGKTDDFTRYVGWQTQDHLPKFYYNTDITVVPTIAQDGLSRTSVEAMAACCPVVASRVAAMVNARGNRHSFTYNSEGLTIRATDPLSRYATWTYDAAERQTVRIDARGYRTTYSFDGNDLLVGRHYQSGARVTLAYDPLGNPIKSCDVTGCYTSTFDALDRITTVASPPNKTITYQYDALGQRIGMIDHDGGVFTYMYDARGLLSLLINPEAERTTYTYDINSRRSLTYLANGIRTSFTYDSMDQLTCLAETLPTGQALSRFTYIYDSVGRRTSASELDGARASWSYDNSYQLVNEHRSGGNEYNTTYTYDPEGNRLLKDDSGVRTTYAYDVASQLTAVEDDNGLTTYIFDANGNQQIVQYPVGFRTTYTWDFENRTTVVNLGTDRNTFTYRADGLRIQTSDSAGTRKFIWDGLTYLAATDEDDMTEVVFTNEPASLGPIISQQRSGQTHYYHFDAMGSVRCLTNSSHLITDTYLNKAFGDELVAVGTTMNPFRYAGQTGAYFDQPLDELYIRARRQAPQIGRWLSLDPLSVVMFSHPYVYVRNSPVMGLDPLGLFYLESLDISGSNRRTDKPSCGLFYWPVMFRFDANDEKDAPFLLFQRITWKERVTDCGLCGAPEHLLSRSTECPKGFTSDAGDAEDLIFWEVWIVHRNREGKLKVSQGNQPLASELQFHDVFAGVHGTLTKSDPAVARSVKGEFFKLSVKDQLPLDFNAKFEIPGGWKGWEKKLITGAKFGETLAICDKDLKDELRKRLVDMKVGRAITVTWDCCDFSNQKQDLKPSVWPSQDGDGKQ